MLLSPDETGLSKDLKLLAVTSKNLFFNVSQLRIKESWLGAILVSSNILIT